MGKLYLNNIVLSKAFTAGQDAATAGALKNTNPHPTGSPAKTAWDAGWDDGGGALACDVYSGGAQCSWKGNTAPTAAVVMALNKSTVPITGTGTNTITATLTQGGTAMASKAVNATSSVPGKATIGATATTNASGVATFTVTGVSAGTTTLTFEYGGVTQTATCTVT